MENVINKPDGIITFCRVTNWLFGVDHGWGNGYVALPQGHKLYGTHYDNIDVDVHGGLTYSKEETIEDTKYWVVGFDTAHWRDTEITCPEEYVIEEVESLYQKLIKI